MAKTTREAANRARAGEGPTFIEAQTYRYKGHSISDPAKYRHKEELESADAERPDPRLSRTSSRNAAGSIRRRSIACSRASRRRSKRASSSPSRASRRPLDALYEDITVAPFIPQE